jgi:CheY-like chemotaxis protein
VAKILIVEDDADVRRLLDLRLKQHGHETAFAVDGVGALGAARREQPDLILLDLGLPGGGGEVVMQRLKTIPALEVVPVIVVSARDQATAEPAARAAGAVAFLSKPIDIARLVTTIDSALKGEI